MYLSVILSISLCVHISLPESLYLCVHIAHSLSLTLSLPLYAYRILSLSLAQGSYTKRLFEDPDLLQKKLLEEVTTMS